MVMSTVPRLKSDGLLSPSTQAGGTESGVPVVCVIPPECVECSLLWCTGSQNALGLKGRATSLGDCNQGVNDL
ncbi:hypothetical protein AAFF_G00421520 [Aldrovandia affinis]|uniref:Uncharacterized protein n=1 Tax=Aldrovandia affinis TaxID=143900 RepID=A0AAD7WJT9_9TELE|nr:hypothetical protein AAFF_G00421520 [Aldrovandia affinis]